MQKLIRTCSSDSLQFCQCVLSVCCTSLAQVLTIYISYAFYICYTIQSSTHCCPGERVEKYMQGTVFTLARLEIVPSYYQELVSHPMAEHVEALKLVQSQNNTSRRRPKITLAEDGPK